MRCKKVDSKSDKLKNSTSKLFFLQNFFIQNHAFQKKFYIQTDAFQKNFFPQNRAF